MLIDGFIHPVFGLLVPTVFKITVLADKVDVGIHHIPDFLEKFFLSEDMVRIRIREPEKDGAHYGNA